MKKILLPIILLLVIVTGCSKDQRSNRKIDGEWTASTLNGEAVVQGESYVFSFDKDKDGEGKGTIKYTSPFGSEVYVMTYFVKNDHLTLIVEEDPIVYTINTLEKDQMIITDSYGDKTVLEKN